MLWQTPAPPAGPMTELEISPPAGTSFDPIGQGPSAVVSPDGGPPHVVADTTLGQGTSNTCGVTLFTTAAKPVQRVSAAEVPAPVFTIDADSGEIFQSDLVFLPDGALVAVPVEAGQGAFQAGAPRPLFRTSDASTFDATADGQRFLVNQPLVDSSGTPVMVIVNWPRLLKN